ncbi:hypothetical protein BGZ51_008324 [Haplosporangium sp. Z 767]|nr:hypothetical protein BGZ51_008324 [Haplosporangium sp. Z 767]
MQILAWYYTVADILLIAQVYYYRRKAAKAKTHGAKAKTLAAPAEYDNAAYNESRKGLGITIATSRARGSAHYPPPSPSFISASASSDRTRIPEEDDIVEEAGQYRITEPQETTTLLSKLRDLDMANASGQWLLGWREFRRGRGQRHDELPTLGPNHILSDKGDNNGITTALLLGWGGAALYLGSRIPQIYKNWRLRSCEGLSLMMFIFSVLGNAFYIASIFLDSLEPDYLFRNMPWWLGACGTLVLDFTIFIQFFLYRDNQEAEPTEDD